MTIAIYEMRGQYTRVTIIAKQLIESVTAESMISETLVDRYFRNAIQKNSVRKTN